MGSDLFPLSSITTKITKGTTPTSIGSSFTEDGINFVKSESITGARNLDRFKFSHIDMATHNRLLRSQLETNDILFSMAGVYLGKTAIVTEKDIPANTNQAVAIIRVDTTKADFNYVYYWLSQRQVTESVNAACAQSAQPNINLAQIGSILIRLPSIEGQQSIAATLSCLDDKIELNNRIIANLEAQAQAIFKSWFVDFEPWGGEAPADWSITTIDSLCSLVTRGITPKYSDDATQIVINQKCIRNHKIDLGESRSHTPATKNEKWLEYGDIVINSTGQGTLGRVAQVFFSADNITVDSHVTIVRPKKRNLNSYLGLWTISKEDEIESMASGSTGQTELSRERVKALTLFEPDNSALDTFANIIEPMTGMIQKKQEENASLAQTRDTLLPKLMSGEIELQVG